MILDRLQAIERRLDQLERNPGFAHEVPGDVAESGGAVPAKVVSKTSQHVYVCDLYEDGDDQAATQTGVDVRIPQITNSVTLGADNWLMANQQTDGRWFAQPGVITRT